MFLQQQQRKDFNFKLYTRDFKTNWTNLCVFSPFLFRSHENNSNIYHHFLTENKRALCNCNESLHVPASTCTVSSLPHSTFLVCTAWENWRFFLLLLVLLLLLPTIPSSIPYSNYVVILMLLGARVAIWRAKLWLASLCLYLSRHFKFCGAPSGT